MSAPVVHGKHSGRNWHNKRKEPFCEPCREFSRLYARERRAATASRRSFTFPTVLLSDDFDGLGATIARAIRESA